jgi:imidazolonepropionase-like amidohydrolase
MKKGGISMRIIQGDRLITGDGKTVLPQGAVLVHQGRIAEVGEAPLLQAAHPEAQVVSYPGCTLLPGLVDAHVHMSSLYRRPEKEEMQANPALLMVMVYKHLQDALSVGITTLRGVGEAKGIGAAIRTGYQKGWIKGPRYYTCERSLTRTGGHGSTGEVAKMEVDGPWALRQAVRQTIQEGADWIKVMDSHRGPASEYTLKELRAVTGEAHRLGRKCCIHAGNPQSIRYAIEAGFDSLEHAPFLTGELAGRAVEKGIAWVPTAYVYTRAVEDARRSLSPHPTPHELQSLRFLEETVQGYQDNLLRAWQRGVLIAAGTDICFPEEFITPIQEEVHTLCQLGIPNLEAIACATGNGARLLEGEDEFGFLKAGLCADLLLVEGDPAEEITALSAVRGVYRAGELLYCPDHPKE